MHFGEHLTLDGYGGKKDLLDTKKIVRSCLDGLVKLLKMRKLAEPVVYRAPGNDIKDPGGWSGFVIIHESHISIHTFPKRGFLSADVYTCQNGLDCKAVEIFFKKKFALKEIETNFIKRGLRYPKASI